MAVDIQKCTIGEWICIGQKLLPKFRALFQWLQEPRYLIQDLYAVAAVRCNCNLLRARAKPKV